jgi:hypothetical protein
MGNAVVSPANVASVGLIAVISASGIEENPTAGMAVNAAIGFPIDGAKAPCVIASAVVHVATISTEVTKSLVRIAAMSRRECENSTIPVVCYLTNSWWIVKMEYIRESLKVRFKGSTSEGNKAILDLFQSRIPTENIARTW